MKVDLNGDARNGEARRFLLGDLAEPELEFFEERLLGGDAFYHEVKAAEDELFDQFVRNELTAGEYTKFVERFGDQQERIAFARTLNAKMCDQITTSPYRPSWQEWIRPHVLAAASVIVVVGAFLLWRSQSPVTPPHASPVAVASTASIPKPAPATIVVPPSSMAVLEIALVTSRGADHTPHLALTSDRTRVDLRIRLNPADRFPAYLVVVRRSDGSEVWRGNGAAAEPGLISVQIPSDLFARGDYELAVSGLREGSSPEDLGYQSFAIDRAAPSR